MLLMIFCLDNSAMAGEQVFVSIPPVKYFVERIAGEEVEVISLLEQGDDPHTFEPRPKQMVELSKARLFFTIGLTVEDSLLNKIFSMNSKLSVIRLDEGIEKIPVKGRHDLHEKPSEEAVHDHTEDHSSGHLIPDPHIWNSPLIVQVIAERIRDSLLEILPGKSEELNRNFQIFSSEIIELHHEIEVLFRSRQGEEFIVFHPSWGYFAREFGLEEIPIELEGKEPKPADLQRLINTAIEKDIRIIFVSPQFSQRSARILADQIEGSVIAIDPLAENWLENMRHVAYSLAHAM